MRSGSGTLRAVAQALHAPREKDSVLEIIGARPRALLRVSAQD
ncbi:MULTISPECIES: hypothetical protein [unclassified Crossiella]|nr:MULTISPECIES: hypothetical protein [unclassified Crossiella]